jgi:hypothetical protein
MNEYTRLVELHGWSIFPWGTTTYNISVANDTLEQYFYDAGFPVAVFLDLHTQSLPSWLSGTIPTAAVAYFEELDVSLPSIWDGILYYPFELQCTYLP